MQGKGEPLMLVNGLSFPLDLWFAQIQELSKDFRVIAPDNRGIGRSDKPDEEYSIAFLRQFAACNAFDHNSRPQNIMQPTMIIYENCGHTILLEKADHLCRFLEDR